MRPGAFVASGYSSVPLHFDVIYRLAVDDAQHSTHSPFYSTSNDLASTTNLVFMSNDRRVNGHGPSLSIGAAASPLTPAYLIEAYNIIMDTKY